MAVAERELSSPPVPSPDDAPRPWLCTFDQFQLIGEAGIFEGQRVELWNGEILRMPGMTDLHRTGIIVATDALRAVFGDSCFLSIQCPFHAAHNTDPEPDIAVIAGRARDFTNKHLTQAALLVEVSLSTLEHERVTKASLYASAGIQDYWIVNLEEAQLEVSRSPRPDPAQPFKFGYTDVQVYAKEQSVAPLAVPDTPVAVADLLP